jgi:hypothetical protein
MGKASKVKGRTQEYRLRDELRRLGWQAERVYCSGAIKGLPGDVKATKGDKTLLFEMKSRKNSFQKIYELYHAHVRECGDDLMAIAIPGARHLCLNLSTSLDAVLGGADHHVIVSQHPLYEKFKRTFSKIENLEKLVGEANVLAIKDDRQPLIYIRYI